ncbi:hypothetical protein LTR37_005928 [Vermiconidia calcicola]|uniref:Uncharacterized protein n=1 Tax=Vermiconidia calcicola TaxID=1690605 RepID=A0ACC3NI65_9PEZI|nr:hypothetical protein LTR37_005928 [Vermiconidia calcicola]
MPINWDAEMDRKLFLAILKVHDITVDHKAVAEELNTEEQPCTTMAIQKRLQKIKTQIKDGSTGADGGTPKPKATPRKRAAAIGEGESPTKKGKTTTGKGGKAKATGAEDGDDAEEATKAEVKQEDVGEDTLG